MPASGASTTRLGIGSPPSVQGSVRARATTARRVRPAMLAIFDCDGILVDSEPISNQVLADALTGLGVPMTVERSVAEYLGRSRRHVEARSAELLGRPLPE